MAGVFFVSDLHLGHRSVLYHTSLTPGAYRGGLELVLCSGPENPLAIEEHDEWVVGRLLSVQPTKRTLWWVLGDVAMDREKLKLLDRVPGRKRLVLGNHDVFPIRDYLDLAHFESVHGIVKKYGMWLTHAPLHPVELRDKPNVHGHAHGNPLRDDPRYLNVCMEWLPDGRPLSLEEIRVRIEGRCADALVR